MKGINVTLTKFALTRIEEIYDYIFTESGSHRVAYKMIDRILSRSEMLALHPKSGQIEPLLNTSDQQSRYLVEGSYKIIYQHHLDKIIITDIFHCSQDPEKMKPQ